MTLHRSLQLMKKASSCMPGGAFKYKGKKKLGILYIVKELTERRGQGEKKKENPKQASHHIMALPFK